MGKIEPKTEFPNDMARLRLALDELQVALDDLRDLVLDVAHRVVRDLLPSNNPMEGGETRC